MEIKVQGHNKNTIACNHNKKNNSKISFQECFDKINTSPSMSTNISKSTNTSVSMSTNISKSANTSASMSTNTSNQVLLEDKKIYDSLIKSDPKRLSNIEFGSKEWEEWKAENADKFFPPLNAPAAIRKAWREVKESIPEDDMEAKKEIRYQGLLFCAQASNPTVFGLPADFKLNSINDYKILLTFNRSKNEKFAKMFKGSDIGDRCALLAELIKNVENKLNEELLKSK